MEYRVCTRCVMDTTAEEITFDEKGVCNFCTQAEKSLKEIKYGRPYFNIRYAKTKEGVRPFVFESKNKKYDCLIGLSGGVDSSYALHLLVHCGYKPLCFSIDNGWNDPRADENIMRLVEGLKVPFYRYTIDIPKFRELQAAFLKAGVKNIEIPTDHILMAASYEMADKYGIKYIISGGNVATESIMPPSWGYNARDLVHIKAIYKKFMGKRLKGLPLCSLLKFNWYKWVKKIQTIYLLDYYDYKRAEAIKLLEEKYGYKAYGEKHCESVWTAWFQSFYLYEKFGIDKRKAHYSSLIASGQMTRDEAIIKLTESPVYPELGIEQKVLKYPRHEYTDYPNDEWLWNFISKIIRFLR